VTVTVEVSASELLWSIAITRKFPAEVPAVKRPPEEMTPPVAVQLTEGVKVVPSRRVPVARKAKPPPVERFAELGEIETLTTGDTGWVTVMRVESWIAAFFFPLPRTL
jgi:hypothetical protein